MILMLGTNDLKASFHREAEPIDTGIRTIIDDTKSFMLEKQNYSPVILLIAPAPLSDAAISADVMDIITGQRDILVDGPGIDGATVHQIAGKTIRTVHFVIPHETRAGWGNRFAVIGSYPDSPIGKITEEVIPDVKVTSPGDDGEILHH